MVTGNALARLGVIVLISLLMGLIGCVASVDHDEALAGKRAVEFAQATFVKQEAEKGYALLSPAAKRYVSLDKFKETVLRLHPQGYPTSVKATEYKPMPGENAIYVSLAGENANEHFAYTLTLEGSVKSDYRVSLFDRKNAPREPILQR